MISSYMSIPSDIPPSNQTPPVQPTTEQQALANVPVATNWDPTGQWSKFLGGNATPQEVQLFLNGLMKTISNELQQEQKQMDEATKKMKKAIEGDDE